MSNQITFSKYLPTIEKIADLLVEEAMERTRGDVDSAARILDISACGLKSRIKKIKRENSFQKVVIYTLAFFLLVISPATLEAGNRGYRVMTSTLSFSSGVVTAFAFHELGHLGAAWATDSFIKFEAGTYNQPIGFTEDVDSDSAGTILNASGLVTQAVGSEIILRSDSINKNSNFVRGMMVWNIINPISYAIDYWFIHRSNKRFKNSYQGDIQGLEFYSGKRSADAFAVGVIAISMIQGFRFLQTQEWMQEFAGEGFEHLNNFQVLVAPEGGVRLAYQYKF